MAPSKSPVLHGDSGGLAGETVIQPCRQGLHGDYRISPCKSGLDGDFKRRRFGTILDLIPNCDDVVKLKAICKKCKKNDAIFTHRLTHESEQTLIGVDNYTSYCRHCYNLVNAFSPPSKPNIKHLKN